MARGKGEGGRIIFRVPSVSRPCMGTVATNQDELELSEGGAEREDRHSIERCTVQFEVSEFMAMSAEEAGAGAALWSSPEFECERAQTFEPLQRKKAKTKSAHCKN